MSIQKSEGEMLKKIHKISAKLSLSMDLKETLRLVSDSLLELTGYDICNIYLADYADPNYVINRYASDKEKTFEGERLHLEETTYIKRVQETNKPFYFCDTKDRKLTKPKLEKFFKRNSICGGVYLPMSNRSPISEQKVQGCIILNRRNCGDARDEKLNDHIMGLVSQSATAINNAIMYETLKSQRDRWHAIFDDSSDGLAIVDENLEIKSINKSLENMLSIKSDDLKDKSAGVLFYKNAKDILAAIKAGLESDLSSNQRIEREVVLNTHHGVEETFMKANFTKTRKNFTRAIISFENISEPKELERNKNEFVSVISHELRSPLTAMKGFLSLLKKEDKFGKLNIKQRQFLNRAYESTDRMAGLVEQILDVNRIQVGEIDLKLEPTSLKEIFDIVRRDHSAGLKEKENKVIVREFNKDILALVDKERVYQVFSNLLENAIKYSFRGSVIRVFFRIEKNRALFTIKDSGVGISPSEQKQIFSKFSRTKYAVNSGEKGSGLGLFIVGKLVKAHGGDIWVNSERDKGSEFNVVFKLAKQNKSSMKGK